jgi:hypothetical protein
MTSLFRFSTNAIASSSRQTLFPILAPPLCRSVQYDASGRLANIHVQSDDPTTVFVRLSLSPPPLLLLVLFLPSSPSCVYSCYCPMLCGRAHIFLQVGKIPSWQSVHGLTVDFASIGVKVKDVYIPPAKTPDGKRRKNNRCFGFVECLNEHHAQRACVSSAFREPSLLSSSSSSVSR